MKLSKTKILSIISPLILAALGALFYFLAMPPLSWWWAALLGLGLLFGSGLKHIGWWIFLCVALHLGLYTWIIPVSALGWVGLAIVAGIFWAVPFWLYRKLSASPESSGATRAPKVNSIALKLAVSSAWAVLESIRAALGWGWLPLAAIFTSGPSTQYFLSWAKIGGEGLVGFGLVYLTLMAVEIFKEADAKKKILRARNFCLAILAVVFIGSLLNLPVAAADNKIKIGLVQPDVPMILEQTRADTFKQMDTLRYLSNKAKGEAEVIFWPEQATPWPGNDDKTLRAWLEGGADYLGVPVVSGMLWHEALGDKYFNAAAVVEPEKGVNQNAYKKQRLVPFGEYIPFSGIKWMKSFTPIVDSFSAGTEPVVLEVHLGSEGGNVGGSVVRLLPLICYEDTFQYLSDEAGKRVDFIVVFANDAWFGKGAREQHASHGILRAVEQGIPVVRVSNNGLSGIVLPNGVAEYLPTGRPEGKGYEKSISEVMELPLNLNTKENEKIFQRTFQKTFFSQTAPFWRWGFVGVLLGSVIYNARVARQRKRFMSKV